MKFLAGRLSLLGLLAVSHGYQAANAEASITPEQSSFIPSAPTAVTRAPTRAPSAVAGTPTANAPAAPPAVTEEDEEKNPVVVIDMKIAGATEEEVEAVAELRQYIASSNFLLLGNTNMSKINVTVEWRGTVVEGGSSPTRFLRVLPAMPAQDDEGNKRCTLNVGDTAYVITITIHGLHSEDHVEKIKQKLALLSLSVISIVPAFNFVCASDVRMSDEKPSMQFQVMSAEEEEKKGPNTAAIVVPVIFGVAFVGAVGFVLVKKFAVGAAVATV
jgi:hypothetical protein